MTGLGPGTGPRQGPGPVPCPRTGRRLVIRKPPIKIALQILFEFEIEIIQQ